MVSNSKEGVEICHGFSQPHLSVMPVEISRECQLAQRGNLERDIEFWFCRGVSFGIMKQGISQGFFHKMRVYFSIFKIDLLKNSIIPS